MHRAGGVPSGSGRHDASGSGARRGTDEARELERRRAESDAEHEGMDVDEAMNGAGPSKAAGPSTALGLSLGLGQPPVRGRARVPSRGRPSGMVANGQGSGLLRFGFTRVVTPTGAESAAQSTVPAPAPAAAPARREPSECPSPASSDSGYVEYVPVHNAAGPKYVPFVPSPSLRSSRSKPEPAIPPSTTTIQQPPPTPSPTTVPSPKRRQPPEPLPLPLPALATINLTSPVSSPLTPVCPSDAASPAEYTQKPKGKGKAEPERRVLPARIRRAAGAGAEAVRELEEMIVDWLERFESLPICITTLPLHLVQPKPYLVEGDAPEASVKVEAPVASAPTLIETPSWVLVTAGEDDQMEARDEMVAGPNRSPSKRLRHGVVGSQLLEDTSDAHYEAVHRKMEAFERRQRIREIDKLKFLRHKMNSRIELLRTLQPAQWNTVVNNVLARSESHEAWARGRKRLEVVGVDWLRRRLVREGVELLKRFDQLLPGAHEHKKQRLLDTSHSSPSIASSMSPPPRPSTPAPEEEPRKKRGRPRKSQSDTPSSSRPQSRQPPSKPPSTSGPSRRSSRRTREVTPPSSPSSLSDPESSQAYESESEPESVAPTPAPKIRIRLVGAIRATASATPPPAAEKKPTPKAVAKLVTPTASQVSPKTAPKPSSPLASPTPALLEAARRREEMGIAEPVRPQRSLRTSSRLSGTPALLETIKLNPFGVPIPAMIETQAEFSLNEMTGFKTIVTARSSAQQSPVAPRTNGAPVPNTSRPPAPSLPLAPPTGSLPQPPSRTGSNDTEDEMRELEGVEASVLATDGSDSASL